MEAITAALAEPFEPREVKFKPQMVKNNRCLAMPYIDARLVQDRLDDVLGVENWQDEYLPLPEGGVMCTLRVNFGGEWIRKTDVGSPSEQPDTGDRLKAAFSDALKRAAVKFGIGRYLYRLPAQWVDYDPVKKQITQVPQLPAWAIPKAAAPASRVTPSKAPAEPVLSTLEAARAALYATGTVPDFARYWQSLDDNPALQKALAPDKEKHKAELAKAAAQPAKA
jgi:hypothetical protein